MNPFHHRLVTGSLLATLSLAALAPAAYAGRGRESHRKVRRFDRERCDERVTFVPQRVVEYRRRSSGGGSTLGGFLGGIAVGAIISSAAQANAGSRASCERERAYYPPPARYESDFDRYSYGDPFCHERYSSLDLYVTHARRHCNHRIVAQVIDNRDGHCVDVIRQNDDDQWESCDRDGRGGWDYYDSDE